MKTINILAIMAAILAAVAVKTTCQGFADKVDAKVAEKKNNAQKKPIEA